ncbi:unnamed protein product, partial [marine sediment metagenome]
HHYLSYEGYQTHESLVFVNLNLRSVVDDTTDSIFDLLLNKFLDLDRTAYFWNDCTPENCDYSDRCYIKYNVDVFRDPIKGPEVRRRLKRLIVAVHFRKNRHITIRDLRSILSFILFNKSSCEQLQCDLDREKHLIKRFYYNSAFSGQESDRIAQ